MNVKKTKSSKKIVLKITMSMTSSLLPFRDSWLGLNRFNWGSYTPIQ